MDTFNFSGWLLLPFYSSPSNTLSSEAGIGKGPPDLYNPGGSARLLNRVAHAFGFVFFEIVPAPQNPRTESYDTRIA